MDFLKSVISLSPLSHYSILLLILITTNLFKWGHKLESPISTQQQIAEPMIPSGSQEFPSVKVWAEDCPTPHELHRSQVGSQVGTAGKEQQAGRATCHLHHECTLSGYFSVVLNMALSMTQLTYCPFEVHTFTSNSFVPPPFYDQKECNGEVDIRCSLSVNILSESLSQWISRFYQRISSLFSKWRCSHPLLVYHVQSPFLYNSIGLWI